MSFTASSTPILPLANLNMHDTSPAPADRLADVRLVSSDGFGYPVRKVFLVAASEVFADMFNTASSPSSTESDGKLPEIKVAEKAKELGLFLKFVDRTARRPQLLSLEQAESLWQIADKYESSLVADFALVHARPFASSSPAVVFGLAVAHGALEVAHEALARFDGAEFIQDPPPPPPPIMNTHNGYHAQMTAMLAHSGGRGGSSSVHQPLHRPSIVPAKRKRSRDASLSDVPAQYLRRFSIETIQNFTRLQDDYEITWAQKASSFRIA